MSCVVITFFSGCIGSYCIFNLPKPFCNSNDTNVMYFIVVAHVSKTLDFGGFPFRNLFFFLFFSLSHVYLSIFKVNKLPSVHLLLSLTLPIGLFI